MPRPHAGIGDHRNTGHRYGIEHHVPGGTHEGEWPVLHAAACARHNFGRGKVWRTDAYPGDRAGNRRRRVNRFIEHLHAEPTSGPRTEQWNPLRSVWVVVRYKSVPRLAARLPAADVAAGRCVEFDAERTGR